MRLEIDPQSEQPHMKERYEMNSTYAPTAPYEVGITYCNDVNLSHLHDDEYEALIEYYDVAGLGLDDQEEDSFRRTHEGTRHVRMVTLIRYTGEDHHVYWHITTEVMGCIHRPEPEAIRHG